VSSIALDAIRNQQAQSISKTGSPASVAQQPVANTSSLQRSNTTGAYSALGAGGPSDWEHFGAVDEEIDDEELFGAKKGSKAEEEKPASAELDASQPELPAQPSPPAAAEGWPTPLSQAAQPSPLNAAVQQRDTFQPTPPPKASTPAQAPASQAFVMNDAVPKTQSPQANQVSQPPPAQQSFVMDDGSWVPPKQSTPAQQQQPPPVQQAIIMDESVVLPGQQRQATPVQHQTFNNQQPEQRQASPIQQQGLAQSQHQQPPTGNTFVMQDASWPASNQNLPQAPGAWSGQAHNEQYLAELKAKEEASERLKAEVEKEKVLMERQLADALAQKAQSENRVGEMERQTAVTEKEIQDLRAELEKVKSENEQARTHAAGERAVLEGQIQAMTAIAQQVKNETDMLSKEKELLIERLKEDGEGKDDIVKERDAIIADLKRQLEAEKSKEPPKPTPADLIPDLDPWYVGSLERYITMLRSEANEPQVEKKIEIFRAFLAAESGARGLEYYAVPPPPPVQEPVLPAPKEEGGRISRTASNGSSRKPDMHVNMPQDTTQEDDLAQYSPGGRPILQPRSTSKTRDGSASQQSYSGSVQEHGRPQSTASTTILTPSSSIDNDMDKTPIQSPPEDQLQPQYKAYVPSTSSAAPESAHRVSLSFTAPIVSPLNPNKHEKHDEIFFGQKQSTPKSEEKLDSRPPTSEGSVPGDAIPAPLHVAAKPLSPAAVPAPVKDTVGALAELLPTRFAVQQPHPRLQEIRDQVQAIPSDFAYISELTQKWEKEAAATRKANDAARQKRQEESEERTDQLFNDNEISYAEIGDIEEDFKEKERQLKAQEDRDEYQKYVADVFTVVYENLQGDIKDIMDLYFETEALLHTSLSGVRAIESDNGPTTKEALQVFKNLHTAAELRHEKVVAAVAERDRRFKKTEIQPLYASNNIAKMKAMEKHFEAAEKQAAFRAKADKAVRLTQLVQIAELVVKRAVSDEQGEVDAIIDALRALDPAEAGTEEVLGKARTTLDTIKASSKDLLTLLNEMEVELAKAVCEADLAQAAAENADVAKIREMEKGLKDAEEKLKAEFQRKLDVLEHSDEEAEKLFLEKAALVPPPGDEAAPGGGVSISSSSTPESGLDSAEEERKRRMKAALEEARRRNGDL
jgi:hypothetical protein